MTGTTGRLSILGAEFFVHFEAITSGYTDCLGRVLVVVVLFGAWSFVSINFELDHFARSERVASNPTDKFVITVACIAFRFAGQCRVCTFGLHGQGNALTEEGV